MTSQNTSNTETTTAKTGKWSGKKRFAVFGVASLLALGTFASVAQSGGGFFGHGMGGHGMGQGHHMGGFMQGYGHGMMGSMRGSHDPAFFEKRLDKKLKHLAIELDATDEQQEKLKTIITALMKEVHPVKAQLRETRKQLHELLIQPKIDRAAIENLRSEKIALVDTLSKKVTQALADAGEVLSVEQRVKLGEMMSRFGRHRRGWYRG